MGCLSKLLSLLGKRERKEHHPVFYLKPPTPPDFIIIPPPELSEQARPSEENKKQTNDECEEPVPLKEFHAVDLEIARRRAAEKGLFVLFKEYQRWDLFNRRKGYWAISTSFILKLLRLETDMKSETEFTPEELVILRDLVLKGWLKKLQNGGTYYYGLNRKTAIILQKQLPKSHNLAY
jgi:hypothetical protein